jgi:hypothetical protein
MEDGGAAAGTQFTGFTGTKSTNTDAAVNSGQFRLVLDRALTAIVDAD